MAREPAIRALLSQLVWKWLEQGDRNDLARIQARLSPGTLHAIQSPLGIGWVPMKPHMEMCVGIQEVLGPEGAFAHWRRVVLEFGTSRMLRGFFAIAGRSGTDGVIRRVNVAYAAETRAVGSARCTSTTATSAIVELVDFPSPEFDLETYVNGFAGTLSASITLAGGASPEVVTHASGRGARFQLSWKTSA